MSIAANQQRTFLRLIAALRPHWRNDPALPQRIQTLLARERSFGSRDRRLYRELLFTTLRYLPWIEPWLDSQPERTAKIAAWLAADTNDTRAYRGEQCGDWPVANSLAARAEFLAADPLELLPAWFREHCPEVFAPRELETQLARAPLWLRLQTREAERVAAEFAAAGWRHQPSPVLPTAWQMLDEVDATKSDAFQRGQIEIQDLGSQLVLESVGVARGGRWLDACAGAGGKSLQLARLIGAEGRVDAHDVRPAALEELRTRAERAGLEVAPVSDRRDEDRARREHAGLRPAPLQSAPIHLLTHAPSGAYDGVLVDAPCSGSGTWRRSPHLKWTTTAAAVKERSAQQQKLLRTCAACVRSGGRLVYATCSLSRHENEEVVGTFLDDHRDFAPELFAQTFGFTPRGYGLTILPARHNTDGFFVAALRRR